MVHLVNSVVPGNMVPSSGTVVAVGLSTVHPKANHAVAFFATQVFASTAWCSATRRINWRTSMIRPKINEFLEFLLATGKDGAKIERNTCIDEGEVVRQSMMP